MMGLIAAFCLLSHFPRPLDGPVGLSALTHVTDDRYFAVDDRGGLLYELTISLDEKGRVRSFATNRCVRLEGRVDLEGCAWDPLECRVWVSDESDASIRQFNPTTGVETAIAPVPEIFRREAVPNRSIEALAIAPDGLRMYAANEDTLLCDGAVASTNRGGVVRIQEFVRAGAGAPWRAARQFRYRTHRIRGGPTPGFGHRILSGVSALAVDVDGASLLVLEREFSRKRFPVPTFHAQIVRVTLTSVETKSKDSANVIRKVCWSRDTGLANFEGIAPGPILSNGTRVWLLVSDAGGGAEASVLVLGKDAP